MKKLLTRTLIEKGWTEVKPDLEYRKGNWVIFRDTSSCWIVGTELNPRVFDVHEPTEDELGWTANLIEHLCNMEDERTRLKRSLLHIQNSTKETPIALMTKKTLEECYHTWLVINNKLHCPVCNSTKEKE